MERLTYKIGEKYAWTFTRKVFEDLKEAMQELTQKVFDIYGAFFHEVDEILHYGDICRKTHIQRPPKKILPTKTEPVFRIKPHARSRC